LKRHLSRSAITFARIVAIPARSRRLTVFGKSTAMAISSGEQFG
jgi:hypothetical protein